IEEVVKQICSCEYILSTSLHGLIVAHAYSIPALWLKKGYIDTDGFKFKDYFSSVDIPLYDGVEYDNRILTDENEIVGLFHNNTEISLIQNSLQEIQQKLLSSFPYPLIKKYQDKLALLEK